MERKWKLKSSLFLQQKHSILPRQRKRLVESWSSSASVDAWRYWIHHLKSWTTKETVLSRWKNSKAKISLIFSPKSCDQNNVEEWQLTLRGAPKDEAINKTAGNEWDWRANKIGLTIANGPTKECAIGSGVTEGHDAWKPSKRKRTSKAGKRSSPGSEEHPCWWSSSWAPARSLSD